MMNRRKFVGLSTQIVGALGLRRVLAAQPSGTRAAVLIGVDKAGDLPALHGAASGAVQVGAWLRSEGFETALLIDSAGPVKVNDIYEAIAALVSRGTLEQLVVYFAGHGFISNYSEYWMLSNAPANPNEAVSLRESIELAKASAITNVVFISDACRSRADSLGTERVRGSLIFPNSRVNPTNRPDVDVFLATLVGDPSIEVPVGTSTAAYEGIYTGAFLSAFTRPDDTMVRTIGASRVVPNNRLKLYLEREVRKRAEAISIQLRQIPDTQVVSGDNTYIGRVSSQDPPVHLTSTEQPATVHDLAAVELARIGIRGLGGQIARSQAEMDQVRLESGYLAAREALARDLDTTQLENNSGIAVIGARIVDATSRPPQRVTLVSPGNGTDTPGLIRTDVSRQPAVSVAVRFADGGGTVLAVIDRFVAHVVVTDGRVVSVRYVPARASSRASDYDRERARIADLHAVVATTARLGVFRIENGANRGQSAAQLADKIRVMKGIDPTLGLYAAYAYSDAGIPQQIRSVRDIMRGDLGVDLFDVAMLAGELSGRSLAADDAAVPFCPMLSQGWSLLRVKNVQLRAEVASARDHLRDSLWTTFDREGMDIATNALRRTA
jgi:hypothetical protein